MTSRILLSALFATSLLGCTPGIGDDDDVVSNCPAEDRFTSDPDAACQENFCGLPTVIPATGAAEGFRPIEDGEVLPLWWGPQGGYHIEFAVETTNLCPVIYIDFGLYDVTDGGEEIITIRDEPLPTTRHVQAIRVQDGDPPSLQRWWTEQFRIPCAYRPNDPNHEPDCSDEEPQIQAIDERDLLLRIATRDHNENREAVAEVEFTVECCTE